MIVQGRLLSDPSELPGSGWLRIEGSVIAEIGEGSPPDRADLGGPEVVITPAFVDAHLHLPQIRSIGCEAPGLLPWLNEVIFPAEAAWSDAAHAASEITEGHRRLLHAGTMTYAGFLSPHAHGLEILDRVHASTPLNAMAGQALMDREGPDFLLGEPIAPLPASGERLRFSVNPRFAVSCTPSTLDASARLAEPRAFVQTHLSEQITECERVRELFPDDRDYTSVYDRFGLLGPRTLLAHGVHLSRDEWKLIAERDAVVVHCPGANTFLRSGLFDLAAAREHGVRLALGSDVAAGPDLAMPRVARAMIEVAKIRSFDRPHPVPSPSEAWTMITRGNADAIGRAKSGRLEVGAEADLLLLRAPLTLDQHFIGRLLYTWRDSYIEDRVLAGCRVPRPERRAAGSAVG